MAAVCAGEHSSFLKCILSTLELLPPVCDNSDILSLIAELGKANVFCSLVKGKDFVLGRKERVGKPCSDVFSCLGILSWRIMCNSSISFSSVSRTKTDEIRPWEVLFRAAN